MLFPIALMHATERTRTLVKSAGPEPRYSRPTAPSASERSR
jgi:hypothetical protein